MSDVKDIKALFPFPRGWFMAARADEITNAAPLPLRFFERKLVAYRTQSGQPVVLDAICPHLGAHLGFGGKIDGDGIRCPFHQWRYGPDGQCTNIPYNPTIPDRARVRAYPAREINGNVFLWHDPEEGEPDYEIPDLPEFGASGWFAWHMQRQDIRTVPHEVIDNIADRAHFPYVHGSAITSFKNEFIGPRAYQFAHNQHETLAAEAGGDLYSEACYHGPGYLLTKLEGHHPSWMLVCHTPIDATHLAVWCGTMVKTDDAAIAGEYDRLARTAFLQDVQIWENKDSAPRPIIVGNDGPILQARAWYRQFFLPRTKHTATKSSAA